MKFITSRLSSIVVCIRYVNSTCNLPSKKFPCGKLSGVIKLSWRLVIFFYTYFVATFATVSHQNTLHFIFCWVIFKIHPCVISTFATTKPPCWNCRHHVEHVVRCMSGGGRDQTRKGCSSSRYFLGFNWQITHAISWNVMRFKRLTDHPLTFTSILV